MQIVGGPHDCAVFGTCIGLSGSCELIQMG